MKTLLTKVQSNDLLIQNMYFVFYQTLARFIKIQNSMLVGNLPR
jgi:hypothetical protein